MSQRKLSLKGEYKAALEYYQKTVWSRVGGVRFGGAQYDVSLLAYNRLKDAQTKWLDSLPVNKREAVRQAEPNLERDYIPQRLQRDDTIYPEHLASVTSMRLGSPKPKSIRKAIEEAHGILLAVRDYLNGLPKPESDSSLAFEAELVNTVSFDEILHSSGIANRVSLLPPVQANRNSGKLTRRALEQAIRRHGIGQPRQMRQEIRHALKSGLLSCALLEQIRWKRFRRHYKP